MTQYETDSAVPGAANARVDIKAEIEVESVVADFIEDGYALVPGFIDEAALSALDEQVAIAQQAVAAGTVDRKRFGGDYLTSAAPGEAPAFVNYVRDITNLSEAAAAAFADPTLHQILGQCFGGTDYWAFGEAFGDRFGVVYQDSRSGDESNYSRIGWHSDHQAFPNSDFWPGIAVTIHLDATSPANGFLRVVPKSHRGSTEGMPLGFEKVRGETAVYAERGDLILHHCDTWHSAARATEDAPGGIRRHIRGSFYAGLQPGSPDEVEPFNKNALR